MALGFAVIAKWPRGSSAACWAQYVTMGEMSKRGIWELFIYSLFLTCNWVSLFGLSGTGHDLSHTHMQTLPLLHQADMRGEGMAGGS